MSSANPPYPYYNGIPYNKAFFDSSIGLSRTQANALYLNKTVADTAGVLETFSSGILSSSVEASASTLSLGVNTAKTSTVNVGINGMNTNIKGTTIELNNVASSTLTTNINNATGVLGTINLMTGSGAAGTVNIATGASGTQTAAVNIGSGTTSGTVSIGNSANTASFGCPLTLNYAPSLITGTTQLGYKIAGTVGTTSVPAGPANVNIYQATLTAGVWILQGNCYYSTPGSYYQLYISSTSGYFDNTAGVAAPASAGCLAQVFRIVNTATDGVGPWYLVAGANTATTVSNVKFNVYRIA